MAVSVEKKSNLPKLVRNLVLQCRVVHDNQFSQKYKTYTKKPFIEASYGGAFYSWVYSDSLAPYGSFGNGSAMRISPIPDYFDSLDDVILYSIASAAATHNHYEGIAGAVITAVAIWMAKN